MRCVKLEKLFNPLNILLFGILLLTAGCSEESVEMPASLDFGYDYFPLEPGQVRIYRVDSVLFNTDVAGLVRDTVSCFLRETLVDSFQTEDQRTVFLFEREWRREADHPWKLVATFTKEQDALRSYRTEGNQRLITLVHPPETGQSFNNVQFLNPTQTLNVDGENLSWYKGWEGTILDVDNPFIFQGKNYPETVWIQEAALENLIEFRFSEVRYARGLGLVFRTVFVADTQCNACCAQDFEQCGSLPWLEKAEKGALIIQWLID